LVTLVRSNNLPFVLSDEFFKVFILLLVKVIACFDCPKLLINWLKEFKEKVDFILRSIRSNLDVEEDQVVSKLVKQVAFLKAFLSISQVIIVLGHFFVGSQDAMLFESQLNKYVSIDVFKVHIAFTCKRSVFIFILTDCLHIELRSD
jgi:hypothetical protein